MKHIQSADNPLFKSLVKLTESARARRKAGATLLDGSHLLSAYLSQPLQPELIILNQAALADQEITQLLSQLDNVPQVLLDNALFKQLSDLKTPTGLLAQIALPQPAPQANGNFVLLLEAIQDPGNLGSILRSAAAAGCDQVYLSADCVDVWSPKVLRAAMGGHFVLQLHENSSLIEIAQNFSGQLFATSLQAQHSLYQCQLQGNIGFMMGNEGSGLSSELQHCASQTIRIPMPGRIESLNVAAATAVCLFEASRQRLLAA